jgi:hypothetical protein
VEPHRECEIVLQGTSKFDSCKSARWDIRSIKNRAVRFTYIYACVIVVVAVILIIEHQWAYGVGALIGITGLVALAGRSRLLLKGAGRSVQQPSTAGLRVVVAINLAMAVLFVFVSFLLKTSTITIVAIAPATLNAGFPFTVAMSVTQRLKIESSMPSWTD